MTAANHPTTPFVVADPPAAGTPEWRRMATASKTPTMLGLSKFSSPYSLWQEMAGNFTPPPLVGDHLDWGHDIEPALVAWWLRHNDGWSANRAHRGSTEVAYSNPSLPFPNLVTLDRRARRGRRFHIVECKTDRDRDRWGYPGDPDSVPADYASQVLFQMGVSGIHEASVVVQLGGSGAPEIHEVRWDAPTFDGIVDRWKEWFDSLADGVEPDLDDTSATYRAVRGLHPDIDKGEEVTVPGGLAERYLMAVADEKAAKAAATGAKSALLAVMERANYAVADIDGVPVRVASRRAGSRGSVALFPSGQKKA